MRGFSILPRFVAALFRAIVVEQAVLHAAVLDEVRLPVLVRDADALDVPLPHVVADHVVDGDAIDVRDSS